MNNSSYSLGKEKRKEDVVCFYFRNIEVLLNCYCDRKIDNWVDSLEKKKVWNIERQKGRIFVTWLSVSLISGFFLNTNGMASVGQSH